jgi:hypothetical protein
MIPLNVPEEDSRLILRSFWVVISFVFAASLSLAGWAFHLSYPWIWGALAFAIILSLAWMQEKPARRLYHAWNNRIVTPISNVASALVLQVCLLIVFTATGRSGSRLHLRGAAGSMWQPHHPTAKNKGPRGGSSRTGGWIRYLKWAVESGNGWAICLIPFFFLIRMVSAEEERAAAGNIYTLF